MVGTIRLFSAVAVRPAVLPLIPLFEAETGLRVTARWEVNPDVRRMIEAGEAFDVVIVNPEHVEALVGSGKVRAGSEASFGRIAMGVAARAGSGPLDLGSVAAFTEALRGAPSIAYVAAGTSGRFFHELLQRLGVADEVRPRLIAVPGGQAGPAVARGEAEIGVVPVTSILAAAPEVVLAGRFPAELQSYIYFAVGVAVSACDAETAGQLAEFLVSPEVDEALAARGVERPDRGGD